MKPSFEARTVYQVGRPAMFDGNRFFPETGTPIWKMARRSTVFDDCEPEPFAVATWMEKSFTTGPRAAGRVGASGLWVSVPGMEAPGLAEEATRSRSFDKARRPGAPPRGARQPIPDRGRDGHRSAILCHAPGSPFRGRFPAHRSCP